MTQEEVVASLLLIRPGAQWGWNFDDAKNADYSKLVWLDTIQTKPTLAEIQAGLTQKNQSLSDAKNKIKDKTAKPDDRIDALITLLGL